MLVHVSNVVVNGKGRRYRQNWQCRHIPLDELDFMFCERAQQAILEVHQHQPRQETRYSLLRGDSRQMINEMDLVDGAIFSPPYPNSFDYTDVYNLELWILGYLSGVPDNRTLRESTLSSHVQIKRRFSPTPVESATLTHTITKLVRARDDLWSPWIPEMIGAYFNDMKTVLERLIKKLEPEGEAWAVVGDSRYAGITVATAEILAELAPFIGYNVVDIESFRSMRSSAQQGGRNELSESLIVFRKT